MMIFRVSLVLCILLAQTTVSAQQNCVTYKLVPRVTYEKKPVTYSQYVDETVMDSKPLTTYKPVWTRETRQRKTVVLKPITKTTQREERFLVRRPVVETSYVEQQLQETSYQTVTEMKEQRWLIEKPVVETEYREERYLVKKPVTKTYLQKENVTQFKPVAIRETEYIPSATVSNDVVLESGRNRLRWLRPGIYVDPTTGYSRYKNAGLHWVPDQQLAVRTSVSPAWLEQQVDRTAYSPETVQIERPVQMTEYVDQIETRKVPVRVSKTSREIMVTKTPVTVRKPVTSTRTRKVPVREIKYHEEILVRRVPVTETTYQRVEQVEPYEVEVCKWVAETKEVRVPRVVRRRVEYSMNQLIPKNEWMRVAVDEYGNLLDATPYTAANQTQTTYRYPISERILSVPVAESPTNSSAPRTTVQKLSDAEYEQWIRRNHLRRENRQTNTRETADTVPKLPTQSILVPETKLETDVEKPSADTVQVARRPNLAGPIRDTIESPPEEITESDSLPPTVSPNLEDPGAPSIDNRGGSSDVEIESNESSGIDGRDDN